ncbi:hypothetical protein ACFL2O_10920 [Thermodesulfobacteriota bacterium]
MLTRVKLTRSVFIALTVLFLFSGYHANCAEGKTAEIKKAIHWQSKDGEINVFLVHDKRNLSSGYRLFVIAKRNIQIIYHTRYNSSVYKKKELKPIRVVGLDVYEYEFEHGFSRSTYWMAIELREYGYRINGMTKTFEGSINRIVPNQRFLREYCQVPQSAAHFYK